MSKEVVQEIQQILFDNGFRSGAKLERAAGTRYKSAKEIETVIANIERQARIEGLMMARYVTAKDSREEKAIDTLIKSQELEREE